MTAMAIRLRRATGDERQQIKWFLYAGSFAILAITVEIILGVPVTVASWLGAMVVPFAIAVALFRYHLYDIDRIINRTVVYGLLSALLGSMYTAAVQVLGEAFGGVANNLPGWAVAGVTPAVASLVEPARRRIRVIVDRRSNRRELGCGRNDRGVHHSAPRRGRPRHTLGRAAGSGRQDDGADGHLALAAANGPRDLAHRPSIPVRSDPLS